MANQDLERAILRLKVVVLIAGLNSTRFKIKSDTKGDFESVSQQAAINAANRIREGRNFRPFLFLEPSLCSRFVSIVSHLFV